MTSDFCERFISSIRTYVDAKTLLKIQNQLIIQCQDYNIDKIHYVNSDRVENLIPDCYNMYFVSKRLEGLSENSLEWYDKILRKFFSTIKKPLVDMTAEDIRMFLYQFKIERNASNCYLDNVRCIIGSFMSWCTDNGYISKNISRPIKKIKFQEKIRQPLSDKELEMLRHAYTEPREEAICELIYSTGCRVSELCNLNLSDVDLDTREVRLLGKGNKYRSSYMSVRACHALKEYLNTRSDDNEALFISTRWKTRISKSGCEFVVKKISERTQIHRSVYPHLLRHTFATNALKRGIGIQDISKLLGHSQIETTMVYAKTCQDSIKQQHSLYLI